MRDERGLLEALLEDGRFLIAVTGFGCAIGVHFAVGYLDFLHLLSAFIGLVLFLAAGALLWLEEPDRL